MVTRATLPASAGPVGSWSFGCLSQLKNAPLDFLMGCARDHGDVVPFRVAFWRGVLVSHPELVRYVLSGNAGNYTKKNIHYHLLKPVAGEGLLTGEGERWEQHRQVVHQVFHADRVALLADTVTETLGRLLESWRSSARRGELIDVNREMAHLTLQVAGRTLLGADLTPDLVEIDQAFTRLNEQFGQWSLSSFLPALPTRTNRRARDALRTLDRVAARILAERSTDVGDGADAVSLLLRAYVSERSTPQNTRRSVRALRDEIVTLLVAGYETTASVLTWAWYLLAHHPSVQQKLFEELDTVLCGQSPGLAELRRLPYTRAVLLETMRLYPPVWIMSRTPVTEDRIGDCVVPAGWLVFLSPYVTHRLRSFWEHPEAFHPDRFLPGTTPNGASHAYFPFGAGPRACIGARFAVLEAELVLAGVAQRYAVRAVSDRPVEPDPLVTLRPRGGVRILLHERSA